MDVTTQKRRIRAFVKKWQNRGNEKQDTQKFWLDLLTTIFGINNPTNYIDFEKPVKLLGDDGKISHGFIDAYLPDTLTLIEQKGKDISLKKREKQSDGAILTPFEQGRRYGINLKHEENPKWIVACNFQEFEIHDMDKPEHPPITVKLIDLPNTIDKISFLIDKKTRNIEEKTNLSVQAGNLVGKIYDELLKQYGDNLTKQDTNSLNQLCVRLVFCLYAEDSGLFGKKNIFYDYLSSFKINQMNGALNHLFEVLDTPKNERDRFLEPDLKAFPYVNGGLFRDKIEIPPFTEKIRKLLLQDASAGFNWKNISPTIFGAVFESTLNPDTRREGGMHYTSVENIHRVIDPLFLNDLKKELARIKNNPDEKEQKEQAKNFQTKLAQLKFFDPACGSGNFLTETYLSLRKLENEAIVLQRKNNFGNIQGTFLFDSKDLIQVSIQQMYGIEINDFAVSVAKTALWIAEAQMYEETIDVTGLQNGDIINFLPLETYENIHEGNALRMDWNKIIPNYQLNYIISNPPFIGLSSLPTKDKALKKEQTKDMDIVFKNVPKHGKLDYVTAWYEKAANMMQGTNIRAAFVSTNSITQGEQVGILWKHLFEKKNVTIIFAYRSFVWNSQAISKAHVHCVIIGFVCNLYKGKVELYEDEVARKKIVHRLNGYLLDYEDIYIKSRKTKPPFNMPEMHKGSQPLDGGGLILKDKEYQTFVAKYPNLKYLIKPYWGANELIKGKKRYCFWLENVDPNVYANNKEIMHRLDIVISARKKSTTDEIKDNAEIMPYLFSQIRQPNKNYIAVPEVSSENRRYIPIAILSKNIIASNKLYLIPTDSLWIFSVLISCVHMSWMRTVAGRLETRYSYSPAVYANFPWLKFSKEQKRIFTKNAKNIIEARKIYPDDSLAILYNNKLMPSKLYQAHKSNDLAVMKAYGFEPEIRESEMVEKLFTLYKNNNQK